MELAKVSVEVGAASDRTNRKEFRAGDACKDGRLLVVSKLNPRRKKGR